MKLQAPSYPDLKVPVILPFLADGILALGGLYAEGVFRIPGDGDTISELKSRMDRGHYVLVSQTRQMLSGFDHKCERADALADWDR